VRVKIRRVVAAAGAVVGAALAPLAVAAAEVSGAGATFPYPIYAKWAEAYKKESGVAVNYQPIGSGEGIRQIQSKEVTFGATDMPLGAADLNADTLVQFPTVMGGIAVVINVEGVKSAELILDGPTAARIFLGEIRSWNDAAIRKLNPNLKLPAQAIAVVHRSDGSGTTFAFTDYLAKVSADWKSKVGSMTSVEWPTGIGASGNQGVADAVARTKGAIGYVEYSYARQAKLSVTWLINKAGKTILPAMPSFAAAASNASWETAPGFGVILTNEAGAETWPITSATFVLMHKQPADPALAGAALKYFDWAYAKGGKMAEELDYVPMPAKVVDAVRRLWAAEIKDARGRPVYAPPK
jgi:phosphate transport system substrate-binding protein